MVDKIDKMRKLFDWNDSVTYAFLFTVIVELTIFFILNDFS